ncbi:hypothetical protein AB0M02_22380 [Actinoplanes sp. NPDC051861]|uniref:nSTAND1 domain-containing NTPase n=1 Tax=Actinoplanes sp. NPDC051861 TaxID=3155170 RepID=UPI00343D0B7D
MTSENDGAPLRDAMRAALGGLVRGGRLVKQSSGPYLIGLLCATSLVPVAAAAWSVTVPVNLAIAAGLGSVGANVLTNVLSKGIERLRAAGPEQPTPAAIERELLLLIEEALGGDEDQAAALRAEIAGLLQRIDAVGALIEAGDADLRDTVAESLASLAGQFSEFQFVVTETQAALWRIEVSLRRQEEQQRAGLERLADQHLTLRLVLEKVAAVEARTRTDPDDAVPGAAWQGCPYRGLAPFEERHSAVYYGRAEATTRLVQQLALRLTHGRMLVVVGASGAGKSSLLRAGLLPRLAADLMVPGSSAWPRRVLTPTAGPLEELAAHLADLTGTDAASVHGSLIADPRNARLTARQAARSVGPDSRVVLVVDQFEELFTLVSGDPAGRRQQLAFVAALNAMATADRPGDQPPALVVVAVRADFLDRAAAFPEVGQALAAGSFVLGPMTESELRLAITGPAAEAGVPLEPGLDESILGELRDRTLVTGFDAGVLPLLSQAMLAVWEARDGGPLTTRVYWRMGGVGQAVQTSAEAAYQALPDAGRQVARSVFVQLTVVTGSGQLACRRASRSDLAAAAGVTPGEVEAALAPFADRRLIVVEHAAVRIAHDALLRGWARLRGWLDAEQADRKLYRELAEDASLWDERGRDSSFLYRGSQLDAAVRATGRWNADAGRFPELAPRTREFLAAARRAAGRSRRLRRTVTAVLSTLTVAALVAAGLAIRSQADLRRQQDVALSRQLAAQSQAVRPDHPLLAGRLAATSWRISPTEEAFTSMRAAIADHRAVLRGHTNVVNDVTFSPRGDLLASASDDGTVRLWDPLTGLPAGGPLTGHEGTVSRLAFDPAGSTLAGAGDDGTVRLWKTTAAGATATEADGRTPGTEPSGDGAGPVGRTLRGHVGPVTAVAFGPRDHLLASAGDDGTVRLWNGAAGTPVGAPLTGHGGAVTAVAFRRDGRMLAVASSTPAGGVVHLWDPATRRRVGKTLNGHADWIWSLAFSRDGRLAGAGLDGTVRVWDPVTGRRVAPVLRGEGKMTGVAFSPDGTRLAGSGSDRMIRLWNTSGGRLAGTPVSGRQDWVWSVAFSPDGRMLATGGEDGTVRLWDPATGQPVTRSVTTRRGYLSDLAFSPDGRMVATATGNDRRAVLWDPATGRPFPGQLPRLPSQAISLDFSPAGSLLAVGGENGVVTLWNPVTRRAAGRLTTGDHGVVDSLAFSRDGTRLATGAEDGTVQVWDPATGRPVTGPMTGHRGTANAITFAAGLVVTAGEDGTVRRWDPELGEPAGPPMTGHEGWVHTVVASPDGRLVATSGDDGTIRLWDPATGRETRRLTAGEAVADLSFAPDGRVLAGGGGRNAVRLWDPATGREIGRPVVQSTEPNSSVGVLAVAFSPDGRIIAHISMRALSMTDRAVIADTFGTVCALYGSLSPEDWHTYLTGRPVTPICS